jgi:hypothetical protein
MRAAAAAVLVLMLALPAGAASPRRAALKLESLAPLVVSGRHFGEREPVILTYVAADLTRRAVGVRATQRGSFRRAFPVRLGRCAAFTVRATGIYGSRAVLQVDPTCKKGKRPPKRASALDPEPS